MLDEYGIDTPNQCLTNIYMIFFMNKYNLDLSKNLLGLNHKKGLYAEKFIYGACYWAFNETCSRVEAIPVMQIQDKAIG